ncbi:MAG: hypothetical protein BWY92_01779 [Firmicutes bacterium ADurb.BinA052]|nr:MAG: hypothetical protein BWY92_01779 [Firmicutes bacterium ADurb.BinA052]
MVLLGVAAFGDGCDTVGAEGVGVHRIPAETVVEYARTPFGPDSVLVFSGGHSTARLGRKHAPGECVTRVIHEDSGELA